MNTAIIVATHGAAAGPLINTTQMIVGQQENIATIDFLPGENVDTLVTKFEKVLQTLDQRDGVIFLVDIYAGSPFNAASLLSMKKNNRGQCSDADQRVFRARERGGIPAISRYLKTNGKRWH